MFDETFSEAWAQRYGTKPPFDGSDFGRLLNHRSIRKFRRDPVPDTIEQALIAAAQSASTSSNLQLWSAISIHDPERRAAIAELCAGQKQIVEAGLFFAFCADIYRLKVAALANNEPAEALDTTEFFTMAVVDTALAAERMVCAAEALGLGICYIGALRNDAEEVKSLLRLPSGTFGVFGLCIGWPAEPIHSAIKPRLNQSAVCFRDEYPATVSVAEYDERMAQFYAEQGMSGTATWSKRSGERAHPSKLSGRDRLTEWLKGQGFLAR
jgi:nitroreductase